MKHRILFVIFCACLLLFLAVTTLFQMPVRAQVPTATPSPVTFPEANFSATPLSGSAPLTVQFTHLYTSTINPILSCTWTFGDGTREFVSGSFTKCPSVSHVYTSAGSFTVQLMVGITDIVFLATKTNYVVISGPLPTATPTLSLCDAATYTLFGRVYDATTNQGIANAQVYTTTDIGAAPNTITGPDGSYSLPIDNPYHGCHILGLTAYATGYDALHITASWQELMAQPQRDFALARAGNTSTPTRTSTSGPTPTRTRTPTAGPSATRTRTPLPVTNTPTSSSLLCSPVTSSITAPFVFDGAGTFCWQSSNLGSYLNSWNTASVTLNGANVTNLYVSASSYPARIGGYWYVSYNSSVAWGHFEAK